MELKATAEVDNVFNHGEFVSLFHTDAALVFLDAFHDGTDAQPDLNVIAPLGHSTHSRKIKQSLSDYH